MAMSNARMVPFNVGDPEGDGGPVASVPHLGPDPAQEVEQQELSAQVQRGLNALETDEALMILLHDLQGAAYEEMAELLQIPLGTVKSRLHRARQALRAQLAPYVESSRTRP